MLVRRELDLDLDDPDAMQVDDKKAEGRNKNLLLLYQLAFDIVENENQQFCRELVGMLKAERDMIVGKKPEDVEAEQAAKAEGGDKPEGEEGGKSESEWQILDASGEAAAPKTSYPPYDMQKDDEMTLLLSILSGLKRLELNLEFLFKNNRSDLLILDRAKKTCEANKSSSVLHSGHMFMHAFMQAGTSSDIFLRQNLDWMSKAVMWAKFATTASLGVVHRGHIKESRNILSAYLPREGQQAGQGGSFYAEGGALFAMGLVHGNFYEPEIEAYLLQQLRQGQGSEVLSHGACLGLGLSSMGTQNSEIVDEMKQALYTDNAVTGEAAAYGMGLVMCGSASEKEIKELLQYAQDTQHEKIIRGCAVALALIMFQKEESADPLVEQLLLEKDPILRYGGCFVIGMAYCGTACTRAIQKLLSLSVSDVNDDVRRAAGMALGFVMCNVPQRVPEMVKLLANSYNPHVRYAAAMALGISSAGSANADAEEILRPLLTDNSDFVRQGAYVSLALLFMQSVSEGAEKFRADITRAIGDKHEDSITRFGALLAQGIIDAGGRNVCASFFAKSGGVRQGAAVGFLLFTQMWYWFPLIHGLSLAFNPTALIGLNKGLKMPKAFSFKSDVREQTKVKQSAFEYPAPEETKKAEETVKTKAVLSTAAKKGKGIKAGVSTDKAATPSSTTEAEKKKVPSKGEGDAPKKVAAMAKMFDDVEKMDVDEEGAKDKAGDSAAASTDKEKKDSDKAAKKKLPALMTLHNPSRVVPAQEKFIKFDLGSGISPPATSQAPSSPKQAPASGSSTAGATTTTSSGPVRYVPLLGNERQSGFLLLEDRNPGEPEEFVEASKAIEDPEPSPPEPFEWVEGVDN
ncbi:unnamed protein product [Amoebophrya sp. A25]|nr:unnamed protein product [Amoebophrya sp. A25]|eukprot:GSA25T00023263001.1